MARFDLLWTLTIKQRPLILLTFTLFLFLTVVTFNKVTLQSYSSKPIPDFPADLHLPLHVYPSSEEFHSVQRPLSEILPILAGREDGLITGDCKAKANIIYKYNATRRYRNLSTINNSSRSTARKYFFALNLYNNAAVLGDIIYQLNEVAAFLGTENVFISVFENGSKDNTKAMLIIWKKALEALHIDHLLIMDKTPATSATDNDRIKKLVGVRNRALAPLFEMYNNNRTFDRVIFLNDILFCKDDVLELIYQSYLQHSHMTCGLDWDGPYDGRNPWFYDTWVARDMNGNEFKKMVGKIVEDAYSNDRLNKNLPFQAYCCWNGMTVIDTRPLYNHNIQFRIADRKPPYNDQCTVISECSLLCKDFWSHGYGRIVIVPRVKVTYFADVYKLLHHEDGPINEFIPPHDAPFVEEESTEIEFKRPPYKTFCPSEFFWEKVPQVIPDKYGRKRDPLSKDDD